MKYDINNLIKFNGGRLALICKECGSIVKEGNRFNDIEKTYFWKRKKLLKVTLNKRLNEEPDYCLCETCKNKIHLNKKN